MKLSDLSKLFFSNYFLNFSKLFAENEVDIWKKIQIMIQLKNLRKKKKIPALY